MGRIITSGRIFTEMRLGEKPKRYRSRTADPLERDLPWLLKTSEQIVNHPITREITKAIDKGVSAGHREINREGYSITIPGKKEATPIQQVMGEDPGYGEPSIRMTEPGGDGTDGKIKPVKDTVEVPLGTALDLSLDALVEGSPEDDGRALSIPVLEQLDTMVARGELTYDQLRERAAMSQARDQQIAQQLDTAGMVNAQGRTQEHAESAKANYMAQSRFAKRQPRPQPETAVTQTFRLDSVGDVFKVARSHGHIPEVRAQLEAAITGGWLVGQERAFGQDNTGLIRSQQAQLHKVFEQMDRVALQREGRDMASEQWKAGFEWQQKKFGDQMKAREADRASRERQTMEKVRLKRELAEKKKKKGRKGSGSGTRIKLNDYHRVRGHLVRKRDAAKKTGEARGPEAMKKFNLKLAEAEREYESVVAKEPKGFTPSGELARIQGQITELETKLANPPRGTKGKKEAEKDRAKLEGLKRTKTSLESRDRKSARKKWEAEKAAKKAALDDYRSRAGQMATQSTTEYGGNLQDAGAYDKRIAALDEVYRVLRDPQLRRKLTPEQYEKVKAAYLDLTSGLTIEE